MYMPANIFTIFSYFQQTFLTSLFYHRYCKFFITYLCLIPQAQPPYIVKSFFLEDQGFFSVSLTNISEEGAIGMDISLYLVRK